MLQLFVNYFLKVPRHHKARITQPSSDILFILCQLFDKIPYQESSWEPNQNVRLVMNEDKKKMEFVHGYPVLSRYKNPITLYNKLR